MTLVMLIVGILLGIIIGVLGMFAVVLVVMMRDEDYRQDTLNYWDNFDSH